MAGLTSRIFEVTAVLVMVLLKEAVSETCPVYSNNIFVGYQTCGNGCCGRHPNYYCCDLSSAAMAGIVLGGIVVICLVVFVCAYCLKKKQKPGRVIRPVQPTASNTIVFTGASGHYPTASHMPMPPPYKRHDSPPPYAEMPAGAHPGMGTALNQYPGGHAGTQAYPYGTRPMGAAADPPPYSNPVPPSSTSTSAPQQYGYGQGHGWSGGGSTNPTATPSEPQAGSSSTSAASAAPPSRGPATTAATNQPGFGQSWPESAPNRNTITTRNFPSRLPPLPND